MENIQQRFKDAIWAKDANEISILVGGAGGIGSWLTVLLSRIGYQVNVMDDDTVEKHNIGGQLYGKNQVGMTKVDALREIVTNYSQDTYCTFNTKKVDTSTTSYPFSFAAFDNMKARRDLFENWKAYAEAFPSNPVILIDGRLEAEFFQIFCVTRETMAEYEKNLFLDDELPALSCSFKQTSHCAVLIAGFMTSFFTNFVSNMRVGMEVRSVPFFTEYYVPINQMKTGDNGRDI